MPYLLYLQALAAFVVMASVAYIGVRIFRRWGLSRKILDHPNERSSHDRPIARGGGIVIVILSLAAYSFFSFLHPDSFSWGYLTGAVLVAAVSWLDDLYSLSFGWRLAVHALGSALLIADAGYFHLIAFPLGSSTFETGVAGLVFTVAWLIWMINAYNFMDGTDGIAALQAIIAGAGWIALATVFDADLLLKFSSALTAASLGFLLLNWQPARIFMGDVGSAFLGFTFGSLPLLAAREVPSATGIFPIVGIIFVWPFIFDTVLTFVRRLAKRHRVWQAHREHLYQRMVIKGMKHSQVALIFGSASALLAAETVLAAIEGGIFVSLLLFSILAISMTLAILARDKKGLT